MSDLLDVVIEAHGGLERWRQVDRIEGRITAGGALWNVKGWPRGDRENRFIVDARRPQTLIPDFLKAGQTGVYEPDRTAIVSVAGEVIEELRSPKESFEGHTLETPWSALQLIYFGGYTQWTYMHLPFLLKEPGFRVKEVEPWGENGETWRRLEVTYPDRVISHSKVQTFYVDAAGLLRRNDYTTEVVGRGAPSAHYTTEHKHFDGIVYPSKRRIYRVGPDNFPLPDQLSISLDYHGIELK